ncbi:MAG: hypothetical protein GKR93_09115 [Gammaproteobacteria bacterium]|nr:hypothetical protein [Gammaproteobacteria bacterium]
MTRFGFFLHNPIKTSLFFVFLFLLCVSFPLSIHADEEETLDKIENAADKIKELIEAYQEADVNFVKKEIVSIKDTSGNPRDCDVAIFYDNGQQARFTTKEGRFEGNFDHGTNVPANSLSLRLSNCECRAIRTRHVSTWLGVIEEIEKVKKVIADEIEGMLEEKASEYAEELLNKLAEKAGLAAGASGFLTGFKAGAELGAAVGDHITEEINKILDSARQKNQQAAKDLNNSPLYPSVGHISPRGWWGNTRGENPKLQNKWDITVRCGSRIIPPAAATWSDTNQLEAAQERFDYPPETSSGTSGTDRQAEQQRAREEAQRQREQGKAEARAERERQQEAEAARRRYEAEQRRIEQKAQEIARTCTICDPIREQIRLAEQELQDAEASLPDLEQAVSEAEAARNRAQNKERQARQRLNEFLNPQSSATNESTGRTATTTDLEVRNQAALEAQERYRSGEASAQETEEAWKNLDDPEKIEELKEAAQERLENEITTAEQEREQTDTDFQNARRDLARGKRKVDNAKDYIEYLKSKLEECIKQCQAQARSIAIGHVVDLDDLMDYRVPPSSPTITPTEATPSTTTAENKDLFEDIFGPGRDTEIEIVDVINIRGNDPYDPYDPRDPLAEESSQIGLEIVLEAEPEPEQPPPPPLPPPLPPVMTDASFNAQCDVQSGAGTHDVSIDGNPFCSQTGTGVNGGTANFMCIPGDSVSVSGTCTGPGSCRAFVNTTTNLNCPFPDGGFLNGGFNGNIGYTGTASVNCSCDAVGPPTSDVGISANCDVNSGSGTSSLSIDGTEFCSVNGSASDFAGGATFIRCNSGDTVTLTHTCTATDCRFTLGESTLPFPGLVPGTNGPFSGVTTFTATCP